jgi:hypothetical protein
MSGSCVNVWEAAAWEKILKRIPPASIIQGFLCSKVTLKKEKNRSAQ